MSSVQDMKLEISRDVSAFLVTHTIQLQKLVDPSVLETDFKVILQKVSVIYVIHMHERMGEFRPCKFTQVSELEVHLRKKKISSPPIG